MQGLRAAIASVQQEAPCDILLYSGPVDREGFDLAMEQTAARSHESVLLLLTTLGGDAHAAFRIARLLTTRYKHFRVLISDLCKSAGTLVVIGAHEIVMTEAGELGPLDVQVRKRDEMLQSESGLDVIQSLNHLTGAALDAFRNCFLEVIAGSGLSSKLCADIASSLITSLYGNIYSQVDPIRLGAIVRANDIALKYGGLLGADGKNLKENALTRLVHDYPAHNFVIDKKEAETLFNNVKDATEAEFSLVEQVARLFIQVELEKHLIIRLDPILNEGTSDAPTPETASNVEPDSDGRAGPPSRTHAPRGSVQERPSDERSAVRPEANPGSAASSGPSDGSPSHAVPPGRPIA